MRRFHPRFARRMAGLSIVELMIAMALGLMVLAGLASLFASSSAARTEMERNTRQIENGRFAVELLADDLRLAGFYGELNVESLSTPGALPDPCSLVATDWAVAMPIAIQGYDDGAGFTGSCAPSNLKPGTDVLVVRRAATCEAGTTGCEALDSTKPYVQVSKCSPQNQTTATKYRVGVQSSTTWDLNLRDCTAFAGLRRFYVRIYYIATDNGLGQPIPTLMRRDLIGGSFEELALVEGIEEFNVEYGIDFDTNGEPNAYSADPTTFTDAACTSCNAVNNWFNVVTARLNVLARNLEPSVGYTDTKRYSLGRDAAGNDIVVNPGGAYRRHAYNGLVRVVNVAQRRES